MEQDYWNEFYQSGSIQSYLSYKKIQAAKTTEARNYSE